MLHGHPPEKLLEDVLELVKVLAVLTLVVLLSAGSLPLHDLLVRSKLVVPFPTFFINQSGVGIRDLVEDLFGS